MAAEKFDRDELQAWLESQPREVAITVAARAALRVLPVLALEFAEGADTRNVAGNIILPVFRAIAASSAAAAGPPVADPTYTVYAADAARAADTAFSAATDAADAAITYAAPAARAAADAALAATVSMEATVPLRDAANARAAIAAITDAADAADAHLADTAVAWATIVNDRERFISGTSASEVMVAPLWPDGMPDELRESWNGLEDQLSELGKDWRVWTAWYEGWLDGGPADLPVLRAYALLPNGLWDEGPGPVNAALVDLTDQWQDEDRAGFEASFSKLYEQYAPGDRWPDLFVIVLTEPEVSTHATSDLWTVDDKLGYAEYARAIYHFLDDPRTEPPLTISIQAPWGGGKTSLMRMVQKQLDPKGYKQWSGTGGRSLADALKATTRNMLDELNKLAERTPTAITLNLDPGKCASVWFNAWRYQSSDQIWAGLAEAIIRGITDRLKPIEREKFLLRLHLSRVNPDLIRTKVYDAVFRRFVDIVRRFGLWVLLGLVILAGVLWDRSISISGAQIPASLSAIVVGLVGAASAYLQARIQTGDEPAKLNLSDYVGVPDYSEKLGFIHHVTEDLRRVFELLPTVERDGEKRRVPLVIFIDDLDRCAPPKVAEVFEAINLFIAGEFPNCYIVIGMDTEVVAAALEEAHKDVIQRLPSYARQVPVGWRFMDKFVQLPFVIPPLDEQAVADYADHLAAAEDRDARKVQARAAGDSARDADAHIRQSLDQGKDESEIVEQTAEFFVAGEAEPQSKAMEEGQRLARQQLESVKRQRYIDERARAFQSDSDKIKSLLLSAKEDFSNNPRELKRLVNVYRFYYNLRLARHSRDQAVPTELQLQNWLKLSLAWPEVVRWLRRSYSEWESGLDSETETKTAIGYRLAKLEDLAIEQVEYCENTDSTTKKMRPPTIQDWAGALRAEFGLPKGVPWMEDDRLFAFLRNTALGDGERRLSGGSGLGFW